MTVYDKQHPETIQTMFSSIAKSYDRNNALLSFQLHRRWNQKLIEATIKKNHESCVVADLCCGTGAITLPWLKKKKIPQKAYLIDFCPEMLECAKIKATKLQLTPFHSIHYLEADVQKLPLSHDSVDHVMLSYGIRNVACPQECFKEVFRILRPHGTFGILELTEPNNRLLKYGHRLYLKLMPLFGKLFAKNEQAYQYLSESIQSFIKPSELKLLLEKTGFSDIQVKPLMGGIATLFVVTKH